MGEWCRGGGGHIYLIAWINISSLCSAYAQSYGKKYCKWPFDCFSNRIFVKVKTEKDLPDMNLFSLRQHAIKVELQLVLALLVLHVGL